MDDKSFKKLLATSIAFKANNKASREFTREGNVFVDYSDVQLRENSNFDKYLNTYLALMDYAQHHDSRSSRLDQLSVDPTEYRIFPIVNKIINASMVMLNSKVSVLQKPLFEYNYGEIGEIMTPAYFNAYQTHFSNIGDKDLFSSVQSFNPDIVTISDIKSVMDDDGSMYVLNPDGSVPSEISYILDLTLPITNIGDYAARDSELSDEGVMVWLSQSM